MESEPADYRNSRVVIGPGYSYVAWHPAKEVLYENIPQRLEDAIDERGVPDQIALGVNGGFVASWDDGTVEWDSLEAYFGLSRWLEDRSDSGIEVSVPPYLCGLRKCSAQTPADCAQPRGPRVLRPIC
jgi:sulfur carrier protein ThiS